MNRSAAVPATVSRSVGRRTVVAVCLLLTVALLGAPPVAGAQATSVAGRATEDGRPLAGVTITVTTADGRSWTGVAGTDGLWVISWIGSSPIEPGPHTVTLSAATYATQVHEVDFVANEANIIPSEMVRLPGYEATPWVGVFDAPMLSDQVRRLYLAAFGREAEAAGVEFWVEARAKGQTLDDVAQFFATSPEFVDTYGALDDDAYVTRLYRNVLDREPDADGLAGWVAHLATGMSRGQVLAHFAESAEFVDLTGTAAPADLDAARIWRLYGAAFRRPPDQPGLNAWHRELLTGGSIDDIAQAVASSEEFLYSYRPVPYMMGEGGPAELDDAAFVDAIYGNVLGRDPDAEGLAAWVTNLEHGMTRGQLLLHFAESAEYLIPTDTLPPW